MSIEDWVDEADFLDVVQLGECKFCKCEIWWIDRKPYDDDGGEQPHECPARVASVSEFKAL